MRPYTIIFALFALMPACNEGLSKRAVADIICARVSSTLLHAKGLRREALDKLETAATNLELAYRLNAERPLTPGQKTLAAVGGGKWRDVWQHADAARASCRASTRVQEIAARTIGDLNRLKIGGGGVLGKRIRRSIAALQRHAAKCGTLLKFSRHYRQKIVQPLKAWASEKKKVEKLAIDACNEMAKSL